MKSILFLVTFIYSSSSFSQGGSGSIPPKPILLILTPMEIEKKYIGYENDFVKKYQECAPRKQNFKENALSEITSRLRLMAVNEVNGAIKENCTTNALLACLLEDETIIRNITTEEFKGYYRLQLTKYGGFRMDKLAEIQAEQLVNFYKNLLTEKHKDD